MKNDFSNRKLNLVGDGLTHQSNPNADLAYCWLGQVSSSFPVRESSALSHESCGGLHTLKILADQETGLPCGKYPRLFLIWLVTEVVRSKKREIDLASTYSSFMSECGVSVFSRGKRQREDFFRQVNRLIEARFKIIHADDDSSSGAVDFFQILKRFEFGRGKINKLTVSEVFFEECKRNAPIEVAVVRALSSKPLAMDLYIWANWRNWVLRRSKKKEVFLTWEILERQFRMGHTRKRNMVKAYREAAGEVKCFAPLNLEVGEKGLLLKYATPKIKKRVRA